MSAVLIVCETCGYDERQPDAVRPGEMLARALAPAVRVNAVAPGLTLPSGDQSPEEFAQVSRENLLRRQVDIEEIARAVELLLTSTSITGQTMFVDCGQRFLPRDGDVMFETRARP